MLTVSSPNAVGHPALISSSPRQRPLRTESLPSRISPTFQVLASISEEYSDVHDQVIVNANLKSPEPMSPSTATATGTSRPKLHLSKTYAGSIRNQTRSTHLKHKMKLRIRTKAGAFNFDRDCGICFDPAVRPSRTKCCGKIFCEDHLHDWLKGSLNCCPVCSSNCHPQAGTISLAPPKTPTIYNTFVSISRSPATPHNLSLAAPPASPVPSFRSQPFPLAPHTPPSVQPSSIQFTNLTAITHSPNSGSWSRLRRSPRKGSSPSTPLGPRRLRSATQLRLDAVSNILARDIARGLARRDPHTIMVYSSESATNPNVDRNLLPSPSPPFFSFRRFLWNLLSYPLSYLFDIDPTLPHPRSLDSPISPFPLLSPTRPGGDALSECDSDSLVRGLSSLGSDMLARVLSMVGMLLFLHVFFIGKTTAGLDVFD
ncbi:hypothetical protein J3R30DRAFT_3693603 [Lentinula aciculospora]|uniref:RING-type domain-containing protein n=1 Tax=Lentinula aciculospora TaxID=153920 RepID=A0A9W9DX55_9AGAR|nr:hypothetical protein J3R30DRAFT_3693603 [Lentinula aciculospora]